MNKLVLFLGLATGNYLYQLFTGNNWGIATERTFFQAIALLLAHISES